MKSENFIVEIIKDDYQEWFIIRQPNGLPVKVCNIPDDVTAFFIERKLVD